MNILYSLAIEVEKNSKLTTSRRQGFNSASIVLDCAARE